MKEYTPEDIEALVKGLEGKIQGYKERLRMKTQYTVKQVKKC